MLKGKYVKLIDREINYVWVVLNLGNVEKVKVFNSMK